MAKRIDPAKAKAKRDKIVAAVLGGVLLIAAVFAVPMTLKQWKKLNGGDNVAATAAPASTPAGSLPATPTAPGTGIADTVSAPIDTATLRGFDLFESKDPFEQQVDVSAVAQPPPSPVPSSSPAAAAPTAPPASVGPTAPPMPEPAPTSAVISVSGAPAELVALDVDFPLPPAEPLFHLESLTKGKAKISIVGGSYSSGAPTVTLTVGKKLTLENVADGTRYELRLLWVGAGPPPPGLVPAPPTSTTPTSTPSTPTSTP
jgi:hypothetical protein